MNEREKKAQLSRGSNHVLDVLQSEGGLYSARQIQDVLRIKLGRYAPGMTTIYRSLETLQRLQLINSTDITRNEKVYEICAPGKHYHHLTCLKCQSSSHLNNVLVERMRQRVEVQHGFEIRKQILEIFGICANCTG